MQCHLFISLKVQEAVRMMGLLLMILALFSFMGGPLALFQGVAWARMLQEYSAQGSFSTALQKTFSGKYRCSLCHRIAVEKQKEKKEAIANTGEQFSKALLYDLIFQQVALVPKTGSYPPVRDFNYRSLNQEPPTPRPRGEGFFHL